MIITLFGKGQPTKDEYDFAYNVGKTIAQKGFILKNGAYGGTMEASAKGCRSYGGKVVGVGVEGHQIDSMGRPNIYNTELIVKETRAQRIQELINCDMIIVMSGQIGTLEELFASWIDSMTVNKKPLIIIGEKMIKLIDFLQDNQYIKEHQFSYINKVKTLKELDYIL